MHLPVVLPSNNKRVENARHVQDIRFQEEAVFTTLAIVQIRRWYGTLRSRSNSNESQRQNILHQRQPRHHNHIHKTTTLRLGIQYLQTPALLHTPTAKQEPRHCHLIPIQAQQLKARLPALPRHGHTPLRGRRPRITRFQDAVSGQGDRRFVHGAIDASGERAEGQGADGGCGGSVGDAHVRFVELEL